MRTVIFSVLCILFLGACSKADQADTSKIKWVSYHFTDSVDSRCYYGCTGPQSVYIKTPVNYVDSFGIQVIDSPYYALFRKDTIYNLYGHKTKDTFYSDKGAWKYYTYITTSDTGIIIDRTYDIARYWHNRYIIFGWK